MDIKQLARVGVVSSVDAAAGTARVAFTDLDNTVSQDLRILTRGSKHDKDYWIPDIDEQVVCLMLTNTSGRGVCAGVILGTFYSRTDAPVENSADVRGITFGDGSVVRHDRGSGNMTIHATGNIDLVADGKVTIQGSTVHINE